MWLLKKKSFDAILVCKFAFQYGITVNIKNITWWVCFVKFGCFYIIQNYEDCEVTNKQMNLVTLMPLCQSSGCCFVIVSILECCNDVFINHPKLITDSLSQISLEYLLCGYMACRLHTDPAWSFNNSSSAVKTPREHSRNSSSQEDEWSGAAARFRGAGGQWSSIEAAYYIWLHPAGPQVAWELEITYTRKCPKQELDIFLPACLLFW